jgi:hypothetical protein
VHVSVALAEVFGYDAFMDIRRQQQLSGVRLTRTGLREELQVPWDSEPVSEAFKSKKFKPKYPGLPRTENEIKKMISKGYLDLGLVDPKFVQTLGSGTVHIEKPIMALLYAKKGTAFVRDTEGVFPLIKSYFGKMPEALKRSIPADISGYYMELASYASEEENDALYKSFMQAAGLAQHAKIQVTGVQGKTGAGYKITMSPTVQQIGKKTGTGDLAGFFKGN